MHAIPCVDTGNVTIREEIALKENTHLFVLRIRSRPGEKKPIGFGGVVFGAA